MQQNKNSGGYFFMSIFTGKGKEVKNQSSKPKKNDDNKLDYKKIKINKDLVKAGDSVRVRLLSDEDYTSYESHGIFDKGILPAPCINPTGKEEARCLYCEAAKHEGFKDLKQTTRFMFAFYDIDLEMIRFIGVSFNQGKKLMDDIEEYADSIDDIAFTLKRQGEGTSTGYKLSPILKLKGDDVEKFAKAEGMKVEEDFFENALYIQSTNQMAISLENAKFDVEGLLGYEIQDDQQPENQEAVEQKEDGDAPEKVF